MNFIFPCEPFNLKKVDPDYTQEYQLLLDNGHFVFLFDLDSLKEGVFKSNIHSDILSEDIIYRGWMLNTQEYETFAQGIKNKSGQSLITNTENYLYSHHLPKWYEELKTFTMRTMFFSEDNVIEGFKNNFKEAFVKDYVKSLTTQKGSIVYSTEELTEKIKELKDKKGHIEGGICLREVINLIPESECRLFSFEGKVFYPENMDYDFLELAEKINQQHTSPFFSIDIARKKDGSPVLIEVGDGQVSDIKQWDMNQFIHIFSHKKNKVNLKI